MDDLALWGGHECTVNRVGDRFFDQTRLSGHHDRIRDLDLFADLGLRALRYPVLWERTSPDRPDVQDWSWPDRRIARLSRLGIEPILGLVHHGSGPSYTNLLDDNFAGGLARFARDVARRYPHVQDWTPVNEPLTTARFSALYGLWYPHLTDEPAFWVALLNQIDAIRLAMTEIRAVTPKARLIQTEDLGRTYESGETGGQAEFDNQRRWMTWDLLCGRVKPGHALWSRLVGLGLEDRLRRIADAPCPPDVVGINHYVTSDRFLDSRIGSYPPDTHGGNGTFKYADVEAIRVLTSAPGGLEAAMEEAAGRYGLPIAVTESHLNCTREEQIRWLGDTWRTALALRTRGVNVTAVTAWALLGSFDWNCLLTRNDGCYESGAFDIRGPEPRPTAIAATLRQLSRSEMAFHSVAEGLGWWRRDIRLVYPPQAATESAPARPSLPLPKGVSGRPLLITGATGTLGQALSRACTRRGIDHVLTDRRRLSLDSVQSIVGALDEIAPWAVINAAGWVRVDQAEEQVAECLAANAEGAGLLAEACQRQGVAFVGFSSDLVFDGRSLVPYGELDEARPLNVYGRSKAIAETRVLRHGGLMIRTAAFFSPDDPHNFAEHVVRNLAAGGEMAAASDLIVSPTYVPDLVDRVLDLLIDGETGIWHLANQGAVSWARFAEMIAEARGFDSARVRAAPWRDFGWAAERPANAALVSIRGQLMPTLEDAVARYSQSLSQKTGEEPRVS